VHFDDDDNRGGNCGECDDFDSSGPWTAQMGMRSLAMAGNISSPVASPWFPLEVYGASAGTALAGLTGVGAVDALNNLIMPFTSDLSDALDALSSLCDNCSPFPPENQVQFWTTLIWGMLNNPPQLNPGTIKK
jgi:hypothetical protein